MSRYFHHLQDQRSIYNFKNRKYTLRQKFPQMALFQRGLLRSVLEHCGRRRTHLVQVPRDAVLSGALAIVPSVTTQRLLEKHVNPSGQQSVM